VSGAIVQTNDTFLCSMHGHVEPEEGCNLCKRAAELRRRAAPATVGDLDDVLAKLLVRLEELEQEAREP
jgi:hypothetical protein